MEGKTNLDEGRKQLTDPSVNLWSTHLSMAEKDNRLKAQNWKSDMDAILIFAGLFSASVTAFIIESYKTLNPDPNDSAVMLLAQISQQLGSVLNNGSHLTTSKQGDPFQENDFSPPFSVIVCNYLWFLSLSFSLMCALSATLVEQWTRRYLQATISRPAPQDRARIGTFLYNGVKGYRMAAIVEIIPMLLHISLFLFFAGLVAFLAPLNTGLEYLVLSILICGCSLYLLVSVLPVLDLSCPFWTPLSKSVWYTLRKLQLIHSTDADDNQVPVASDMTEAREYDAIQIGHERDERDLAAICWTIRSQREDHEFESFVEVIPSVVAGFDFSSKWLINALLDHADPAIRLGRRIPKLLVTCTMGSMEKGAAERRAITCISSIWSLAILDFPRPLPPSEETWMLDRKFKADIFDLLRVAQTAIPPVTGHVLSASAIIARGLLDMYMDRVWMLEEQLITSLVSGQYAPYIDQSAPNPDSEIPQRMMLLELRLQTLQKTLAHNTNLTTAPLYVLLHAVVLDLGQLVTFTSTGLINSSSTFLRIELLQELLSQAGFRLAVDYVGKVLASDRLPHEAFTTLRRLFLRVNLQLTSERITADGQRYLPAARTVPISKDCQEKLVAFLEEATEYTTPGHPHLPVSMVNIIVRLCRYLSDPTLVLKAIAVLESYALWAPDDDPVNATLIALQSKVPHGSQGQASSRIFGSHVSSDARPDRPARRAALQLDHNAR